MNFRGLLVVVFGIGLIVAGFVSIFTDFRYAMSGVRADGAVTRTWEESSRSGPVTHCAYTFRADGRWYTGADNGHRPGDRIEVVYLENDPEVSRISTTHAFFPLGLLEFVLGGMFVFFGLTRAR